MSRQQTLPLVSSRAEIAALARSAAQPLDGVNVAIMDNEFAAAEYLGVEMPPLSLMDFNDPQIDTLALLSDLGADPWLLPGGVVAVYGTAAQARAINDFSGGQILMAIHEAELERKLPLILRILSSDDQLSLQRRVGLASLGEFDVEFSFGNDVTAAVCYAGLVSHFLFAIDALGASQKQGVQTALTELLLNAVEHGNCGISHDEKADWLAQGRDLSDLIDARCEDQAIAARRVSLNLKVTAGFAELLIRDEGAGFDWRPIMSGDGDFAVSDGLSGRGLMLARAVADQLRFNERGNEVWLRVKFAHEQRPLPPMFADFPRIELQAGQSLFEQGDDGHSIYFIVRGRYAVIFEGEQVYELQVEDVVIGEMSFLLNHPRSATVQALDDGELIEVSRRQFMDAIRVHPHYAMALCRLLALRLASQTRGIKATA